MPEKIRFLSYPTYTTHCGILNGAQNVEYFELLIPEIYFSPIDSDMRLLNMLVGITEKKYFPCR